MTLKITTEKRKGLFLLNNKHQKHSVSDTVNTWWRKSECCFQPDPSFPPQYRISQQILWDPWYNWKMEVAYLDFENNWEDVIFVSDRDVTLNTDLAVSAEPLSPPTVENLTASGVCLPTLLKMSALQRCRMSWVTWKVLLFVVVVVYSLIT